jgi:hypothetical protein
MIITKIKAGLGNQMFQYAFGRALSLKRNEPLYLDITSYDNQSDREAKREFILNKFNIQAAITSPEMLAKYNSRFAVFFRKLINKIKKIDAYAYYPSFLKSKGSYYEGYWINQKYFLDYKEIIQKELSLKDKYSQAAQKIADEIVADKAQNVAPVSLHIRRGDFVSNPHSAFNGVLGVPHYLKAVETLTGKLPNIALHIFVFSDDIAWAKENLKLPCAITFVSNPSIHDYEEINLMSLCSHHIIANSTFSWWGAWLCTNPGKIVIAPYQWLKERTAEELDLLPSDWLKI